MSVEEIKYLFSYSRKDSEFVLRLAKDLRAVGANIWLDQLDILGGEHWDQAVEKALKSCKGMLTILSPDSVASDNVMDEVSYALNKGKLVVPVLIRSCEIPLRLERLHYIDFTDDYDTGFSQLLRALNVEQPVEPPESAAAREPVVQDSTAPLEEEAREPPVGEEQAAQEAEEPSLPEVSEPTPRKESLMAEEMSESKPSVKEELENTRKQIKEEMKKASSKATITFAIVAIVAALVTGLGVYYFAKDDIINTAAAQLTAFSVPVGTIVPYGGEIVGTTDPCEVQPGWFFCNGASLVRNTYGELSTVIGTAFGAPDQNTFNLPDLRGRFVRGVDHGQGRDPDSVDRKFSNQNGNEGDAVGSLQEDQLKSHQHSYVGPEGAVKVPVNGASNQISGNKLTGLEGGKETRPKNIYVNWIIKAKL